jgi:CCR4-NOT transcription complex subunit 9
VSTVLNNMVMNQLDKPSTRLLKHIIRCYNSFAENPRARLALKENLPVLLKESRLHENLDESSKKCLKNLNEVI